MAGKPVYTTTAIPAMQTPLGTMKNCGHYYDVVSGDYYQMIAMNFSITFDVLRTMNPQLGTNCTNLWANASYCVATVRGSTLTPVSVLVRSRDCYLTLSPISDYFIVDAGAFSECDQASLVVDIHGFLIGRAIFQCGTHGDSRASCTNASWSIQSLLSMVYSRFWGLLLPCIYQVRDYVRPIESVEYSVGCRLH